MRIRNRNQSWEINNRCTQFHERPSSQLSKSLVLNLDMLSSPTLHKLPVSCNASRRAVSHCISRLLLFIPDSGGVENDVGDFPRLRQHLKVTGWQDCHLDIHLFSKQAFQIGINPSSLCRRRYTTMLYSSRRLQSVFHRKF